MKLISILLTIYTLTLSVLPCADGYPCNDEVKETSSTAASGHSTEDEDFCSPFCVCACCARSVGTNHFAYDIKITTGCTPNFNYQICYVISQPQRIWQPPKLS